MTRGKRYAGFGLGAILALAGGIFAAAPYSVAYSQSVPSDPIPASTTTSVPVPSANCTPPGGTIAINLNDTVICSFSGTPDVRFLFWSAPGFSPQSSTSLSSAFTAVRAGSGTITARWSSPGVGVVSQTFSYQIVSPPAANAASCEPSDGTIAVGGQVSCTFSGSRFMFWSAPGFKPLFSNSPTTTFTATQPGTGTITGYWSVLGQGAVTRTFTYSIAP